MIFTSPQMRAAAVAESPIETKFLWALMDGLGFRAIVQRGIPVAHIPEFFDGLATNVQTIIVAPQATFGAYRVDFALYGRRHEVGEPLTVIVECDGKAFHSKDWQKARDKKRDDFMRQWGAEVVRLRGSDIYRYPQASAARALRPLLITRNVAADDDYLDCEDEPGLPYRQDEPDWCRAQSKPGEAIRQSLSRKDLAAGESAE